MNTSYGRDLDLNLLRVFVVVAEESSVTGAAARLYLTQPAVSAALRRLTDVVGAPLYVRQGRGIALTARGQALLATARPMLDALVNATLSAPRFDPRTSDRVVRLGLADSSEPWLLPRLMRALESSAPRMRIVAVPVQFRTVGDALARGAVDLAITVADELPDDIRREPLFSGGFVALSDPRFAKLRKKPTREAYFASDHVIVSYNGDLRGIVEDLVGEPRRIRVSVSSFHVVGALVDGSALVATIPKAVASEIVALRPHLRMSRLPFELTGAWVELLWRVASQDDPALGFVADVLRRLYSEQSSPA